MLVHFNGQGKSLMVLSIKIYILERILLVEHLESHVISIKVYTLERILLIYLELMYSAVFKLNITFGLNLTCFFKI